MDRKPGQSKIDDDIEKLTRTRPYHGGIRIVAQTNARLSAAHVHAPAVLATKQPNVAQLLVPKFLYDILFATGLALWTSQRKSPNATGLVEFTDTGSGESYQNRIE